MDSKNKQAEGDVTDNKCPICFLPADKSCAACSSISYCSPEHQKSHWKVHKNSCSAFTLKETPEMGRHYVASRDLKAGSLVIREFPVSFAPQSIFPEGTTVNIPSCLVCCSIMTNNPSRRCSKCKWPLCSTTCEKIVHHTDNECKIFAKRNVKYPPKVKSYYKGIMILRTCLQKKKNPKIWEGLLDLQHEYDLPRDSGGEAVMNELKEFAEKQIKEFKVADLCGSEDWVRMLYAVNINSFGINMTLDNRIAVGGFLYLKASMFSHSCAPNCSWGISSVPDLDLKIRTTIDIKKGEMLTVAYNQIFNFTGTHNRQQRLRTEAGFVCKCARCISPTELGSNASTWICSKCNEDTMVSTHPLQLDADWKCSSCGFQVNSEEMMFYINSLYGLVEICGKDESGLLQLRRLISDNSGIKLHPNHWVLTEAARRIVQYLGNERNVEFTDEEQAFYIFLCKRMLGVADIVSPGISKERAQLQHFLANEMLRKTEKDLAMGKIDCEKFQDNLKTILTLLQGAHKFFKTYNSDSSNGQTGPIASLLLDQINRVKTLQVKS